MPSAISSSRSTSSMARSRSTCGERPIAGRGRNRHLRPVDESKYNIYRTAPPEVAGEQSWFGLGEPAPADHDFGGVVLARDNIGRYRMVDALASKPTPDVAVHILHDLMRTVAALNMRPSPL